MICSIHQPNFFPWLGYFDKINKSDVFIFLDNVAYPKSGKSMSSYTNRVSIAMKEKNNAVSAWIYCPVIREHGVQIISDVMIDDKKDWRSKLVKTLELNYKKASHYEEVMPVIANMVNLQSDNIADYNYCVIKELCNKLNINTDFVRHKDIETIYHSTELLIELTKKVNCDTYICGGGSSGYQEDELFESNGIKLLYQNFKHPLYNQQQNPEFLYGQSIIDVLFNIGFNETERIIKCSI